MSSSGAGISAAVVAAKVAELLPGIVDESVLLRDEGTGRVAETDLPDRLSPAGLGATIIDVFSADGTLVAAAEALLADALFIEVESRNLYNPADPDNQPGFVLVMSGGRPTTASGIYTTIGYTPVSAGLTYTASNPRLVAFYNSSKVYDAGVSPDINNPTNGPVTFTPAADGYVRISYVTGDYGSTFQLELGSSPTAYQPFGLVPVVDAAFAAAVAAGINVSPTTATLARTGDAIAITTALGGKPLVVNANLKRTTTNNAYNIDATTLDGATIHGSTPGDDVTPIRTQMGTLGANHGFTCVSTFTNPDAKTLADDAGSVWTDGTREYVLLGIDGTGRLVIGGDYVTDGSGVTTSANVAPTVNLTHVSGATHTGAIDYLTKVAAQLYPSTGRVSVKTFVNDATATGDGTAGGQEVVVKASADIYDYADLYDKAKANLGVSYATVGVAGAVRVEETYRYTAGGRCRISTALTELKPTTLGQCGFVQAVIPVKPGQTVTRHIPGIDVVSGNNWGTGVDMTSYAVNTIITTAHLLTPGVPPAFSLDRIHSGATTLAGYAMGYLPYGDRSTDVTNSADRIADSPTILWDLRSTKKNYPNALTSLAAGWGRVTAESFRLYLSPAQTDAVIAAGPDARAAWAVLDAVASLT